MKLNKFLSTVILITLFSVLYVYQQTEVFRLAYVGQKKQAVFQDSLDKNSILRYNINRNASLVNICNKVLDYADFHMPESYRLVKLTPLGESSVQANQTTNRENIFSRFFGITRQAEAKTINP
ncbi:hypothetical protein D4R78_00185 [bacterium]|nr:MAG: hypothetical protein D4R78_00185 [bacterium]